MQELEPKEQEGFRQETSAEQTEEILHKLEAKDASWPEITELANM